MDIQITLFDNTGAALHSECVTGQFDWNTNNISILPSNHRSEASLVAVVNEIRAYNPTAVRVLVDIAL